MPRYLALDYLTQAINERQNTLYRTLLAVPHHLECVDSYAHKGKIDDKLYSVPWEKELPDKILDQKPEEYLYVVTSSISSLEGFTETNKTLEDEIIPSSNPDSPIVNFDVWTDLEEEVLNYVVESFKTTEDEEFVVDNTYYEDEYLLEEQESTNLTAEARSQIPTLPTLCSRLKPKTLQDPFTDNQGNPVSEDHVFKLDKTFTLSDEEKVTRNQVFKETFTLQHLDTPEEDLLERNMELEIPSFDSPTVIREERNENQELTSKMMLNLNKENESYEGRNRNKEIPLDEINAIAGGTEGATRAVERFNDNEEDKARISISTDFITINTEGSTCPDEKTHLEDTLESPQSMVYAGNSKEHDVLKDLSPIRVSPESQIMVVTPSTKGELISKMWQEEKMFNDILVKTLPVPRVPQVKQITTSTCIDELYKMSCIKKEEIKGDLELQLSWDPLVDEVRLPDMQKRLARVELMDAKRDKALRSVENLRETFQIATYQEEENITPGGVSLKDRTPVPLYSSNSSKEDCKSVEKSRQPIWGKAVTPECQLNHIINSNSSKHRDAGRDAVTNPFSSLDDFLILRSVQPACSNSEKTSTSYRPPKTVVKAAKVRPSMSSSTAVQKPNTEEKRFDASQKDFLQEAEKLHLEVKRKVVNVELSPEFREIVDFLSTSIHPFLARLKENGIIHQERDLVDLTPDYTRFVIKQLEVSMTRAIDRDQDLQLTYKLAICLHALVGALDLLVHCGLSVALAHLSYMHERYVDYIANALESIRRHLFNAHFKFQQNSVLHPKISKVLDTIRQWTTDEQRYGDNSKVLIIANRHTDQLYKELKEIISSFGGIRVSLFTDISELDGLDSSDVVVASTEAVNAVRFPWSLFSFVIEYEHKTTSVIKPESTQTLREHIALMMQHGGGKDTINSCNEGPTDTGSEKLMYNQDQYVFIGSKKIVTNTRLLHLLEARHNIMIYERDYSCLVKSTKDSQNKMNLQPDILIDERTCIVISDLPDLRDSIGYEKLKDLVLSLSLKCLTCYVILCCDISGNMETINNKVSSHLSMLFATAAHFKQTKNDFKLGILYSTTAEETAVLIRKIGDQTRQDSKAWDQQEWVKRKWLTDEMSLHERFLLSFPCMNSFSAQVMLTAASLSQLLTMTLDELKATYPWIPDSILTMFYYTSQSSSSGSVGIQNDHRVSSPLSCKTTYNTTANTESLKHGQTIDELEHIDTHEPIELANHATGHQTPSKSINTLTPKSHASDDSLWLAMESDGVDLDIISSDNHTANHHHHNLEHLREVFPEKHDDEENEAQRGFFKTYFDGHNQNNDFLMSSYNDELPGIMKDRTKGVQLDRPSFPSAPQAERAANTAEYYGQYRDTRSHGTYVYIQDLNNRALNRQRTTNLSVPMFKTRRTIDKPQQQEVPSRSIYHEHHFENDPCLPDHRHGSRIDSYNKPSNNVYQYLAKPKGGRLLEAVDSMKSIPGSSLNQHQQVSSYFGDVQEQKRGSSSVSSLLHRDPEWRGLCINTNVGVAQPLRRSKGREDRLVQGKTRNNLPMFEDLFGSTPKSNTSQRKALKEHEVPHFQPSPDDYFNDLSIFSTISDSQVPAKRPKLIYERVPGAKDGQTKLTFS